MKKSNMIILSIIIVLAILGGIGFWKWESGKKTNISKENIDQKQEPHEEVNAKENVSEENLVWYEIPELGIKIKADSSIKDDINYAYKKFENISGGHSSLTLKSISSKGNFCSAESGPLGIISRIDGLYKKQDVTYGCIGGFLVKQFDEFFICYTGPQVDDECLENNSFSINDYFRLDSTEKI